MIKPIITSELILSRPSVEATPLDAPIARDLADTLVAHAHHCVGMAANMVGVNKRIIAFDNQKGMAAIMFNPVIVERTGAYQAEESCLSLEGVRETTRYKRIKVRYQDEAFVEHERVYTGFVAQIIQHEVDHCDGIVI